MSTPRFTQAFAEVPGKTLQFHIQNVDVSVVNALRRVLLSNIPNVAIRFDPYNETEHDVNVIVNTGCLHNEFISHRMSLIPICMQPDEIDAFEKARSYKYVIHKKNQTNAIINVTTDDIIVYDHEGASLSKTARDALFPKDRITGDPILITKLKPNLFQKDMGDEIHLEAFASVGTATDNAAWSPVSLASFYNAVDEDAAEAAFETKMKAINVDAKKKAQLRADFNNLEKFQHYIKNDRGEPNDFVFSVESECAMTPTYLVNKGLTILAEKVEAVAAGIREDSVKIEGVEEMCHLILRGETHTIGNLLQAQIYNKYVRDGAAKELEYVGYLCPHPLEKTVIIKFKFHAKLFANDDARAEWIASSIDGVHQYLLELGNLAQALP